MNTAIVNAAAATVVAAADVALGVTALLSMVDTATLLLVCVMRNRCSGDIAVGRFVRVVNKKKVIYKGA